MRFLHHNRILGVSILVLVAIGLLLAGVSWRKGVFHPASKDYKIYADSQYGFRFDYPANLSVETPDPYAPKASIFSLHAGGFRIAVLSEADVRFSGIGYRFDYDSAADKWYLTGNLPGGYGQDIPAENLDVCAQTSKPVLIDGFRTDSPPFQINRPIGESSIPASSFRLSDSGNVEWYHYVFTNTPNVFLIRTLEQCRPKYCPSSSASTTQAILASIRLANGVRAEPVTCNQL